MKNIIIRDTGTLFEQEDDYYYKPRRVSNFWNNNYTECESNSGRSKNLSLEEYFDKIGRYLRDIIFGLQNLIHIKFS